jgi:hypothetical protein
MDEGEEYSNYISDVTNEHKGKTIKAVSAFLLFTLSDKYTSTKLAEKIILYLIELMDFGIKGSNVDTLSQYTKLNPNDNLFKISSLEFHIETSFLIFSILTPVVMGENNLKYFFLI